MGPAPKFLTDAERLRIAYKLTHPNWEAEEKAQSEADARQAEQDRIRQQAENARRTADAGAAALGGIRAWQGFTVERWKCEGECPALEAAKSFDARKENLLLVGTVGTGKTHLAVAAARKYHPTPGVGFLRQAELSREVRSAEYAWKERDIILRWARMPVLILDDLGAAKDTEFMVGLIYEIIDWRYMNVPGGLIVTTNRTLDQLAEKLGDDRVPSRLAQMCRVFTLTGKDYRLAKRQQ